FRHYLLGKFHALPLLRLAGLGTYVAGCYRDAIGEGYHRFLPFVDWWFEVEDIEPSAGKVAISEQFQEARPIDNVPSRSIDQVRPSSHHPEPFTVQKMVTLRSVWNVDRENLCLLYEFL